MSTAAPPIPAVGQVVRCRGRAWLVDAVEPSSNGTLLSLSCLEDDSQGEQARVIWEAELGTSIIDEEAWRSIGSKNGTREFDDTRFFSAFYRTLRWNCVTATDPRLFQSPFRAGIRVEPYQLEPLRKALLLPRVNLFIADDVGLGKTIEAGLIASELLLRRRVRDVVVVCPPSMLTQWQDELTTRFGLVFQVLDRLAIERIREERGWAVNPWDTFPRWLVSSRLLIDEAYKAPLVTWLGPLRPSSLLIFDEALHAASSSNNGYAIDSRITRAIRDIALARLLALNAARAEAERLAGLPPPPAHTPPMPTKPRATTRPKATQQPPPATRDARIKPPNAPPRNPLPAPCFRMSRTCRFWAV